MISKHFNIVLFKLQLTSIRNIILIGLIRLMLDITIHSVKFKMSHPIGQLSIQHKINFTNNDNEKGELKCILFTFHDMIVYLQVLMID